MVVLPKVAVSKNLLMTLSEDSLSLSPCVAWQVHLPFAVVGSTEEVKIGNKMAKARQYPWGVVQGTCGTQARDPLHSTLCPPPTSPLHGWEVLNHGQVEGSGRVVHLAVVKVGRNSDQVGQQ